MEILWKVVGIGLTASVFGVLLKNRVPEMELLLTLASACLILVNGLSLMPSILSFFSMLSECAEVSESVLNVLWKAAAIALLTHFSSELCSGAGYPLCASSIETTGKLCLLWEALPLLEAVTDTVTGWGL